MTALTILPLLAYLSLAILLRPRYPELPIRGVLLRAAILWGAYLVLIVEALSLFEAVHRLALALVWLVPTILAAARLLHDRPSIAKRDWQEKILGWDWLDSTLLAGIVFVLAITFVVAVVAPPQTPEAMRYHMSRVAHWAQQASVRHFATGILQQNSLPPFAEYVILQVFVLMESDRLANIAQWSAMLGSVIGVSWVAFQLGVNRTGQLLASVFAGTIPMGIIQASSAVNDYVGAFWLVCVASETVYLRKVESRWRDSLVYLGLAAGLALATKPTTFPFLLPFGLAAGYLLLKRFPLRKLLPGTALALFLGVMLVFPYLVRQTQTFGSPINPAEVAIHSHELRTPAGVLSTAVRNAAFQASTPWTPVNQFITRMVFALHAVMDLDPNDPRTTSVGEFWLRPLSQHEDLSPSPLHAFLALAAALLSLVLYRRIGWPTIVYILLLVAGFFGFSLFFKWQVFGNRYTLPFLVLMASAVAAVSILVVRRSGALLLGLVLILTSWPWLTGIPTRPLITQGEGAASILTADRKTVFYRYQNSSRQSFARAAEIIDAAACREVALILPGGTSEYLIWQELNAYPRGIHLNWIVAGAPSAVYEIPDYQPCAVLCLDCPEEWETVRGVPLVDEINNLKVFAVSGEVGGQK